MFGEIKDVFADIIKRFTYHPPKNEEIKARHSVMRDNCLTLAQCIVGAVPPGREQSLALTKLEECMMWANAGIARNQP